MSFNILITGGGGTIGSRLTRMLEEKGHVVSHLSRKKSRSAQARIIHWEPSRRILDFRGDEQFDHVIHLAGEGISDKRWTRARKAAIIESRTATAELLLEKLKALPQLPRTIISASAIGYYGAITSEHVFREDDGPGNDFIAQCCFLWESAIKKFAGTGMGVAIVRTGVVFSGNGGILEKMSLPVRYYAGAPLGSGNQYVPWVHLNDICRMYIFCLENDLRGTYNGVAPGAVTNRQLTEAIASIMKKPLWLPNLPSWALKMIMGEMSVIALEGSRVSCDRIMKAGFRFEFETAEKAVKDLMTEAFR